MSVSEEEKRRFGETTGLPHPSEWDKITQGNVRLMHRQAEADAIFAGLRFPLVMYSVCADADDYNDSSDRRVETQTLARKELVAGHVGINEKRVINRTYYDQWSRTYWVFSIGEQPVGRPAPSLD